MLKGAKTCLNQPGDDYWATRCKRWLPRHFRDFSSVFAEVRKNAETYFGSLCPGSNPGGVVDEKAATIRVCGFLFFRRNGRKTLRATYVLQWETIRENRQKSFPLSQRFILAVRQMQRVIVHPFFVACHSHRRPGDSQRHTTPCGLTGFAHSHRLADFVVRTIVAAHETQVTIESMTRENALRLSIGEENLYPDGSFTVTVPGRPPFLFYVELVIGDNYFSGQRQLPTRLNSQHAFLVQYALRR